VFPSTDTGKHRAHGAKSPRDSSTQECNTTLIPVWKKTTSFYRQHASTIPTKLILMQQLPALMTKLSPELLQMMKMTKMRSFLSLRTMKISIEMDAKSYLPSSSFLDYHIVAVKSATCLFLK
jgi:hypothetical protein